MATTTQTPDIIREQASEFALNTLTRDLQNLERVVSDQTSRPSYAHLNASTLARIASNLRVCAALLAPTAPEPGDKAFLLPTGEVLTVEFVGEDGFVWFKEPTPKPNKYTKGCHISRTVKLPGHIRL